MATITRTNDTDDDGSGTTGTIRDAAWKDELYDQIDAVLPTSGTWTVTISGEGGSSGQAYTTQTATWVRSDKGVHVRFIVVLSTLGTITGNVIISGLPVAVAAGSSYHTGSLIWFNTTTSFTNIQGLALAGTTTVRLYGVGAAAASMAVLAQADLSNTTQLHGDFWYQVD